MPKRWRMLSLAGFQEELYVAYRKGIYFHSPFDSKSHKELSYRSVTLSAYILRRRVPLESAGYMKLRRRTGEEYAPRSLLSSVSFNSSSVTCLCALRLGNTLELSTGMELEQREGDSKLDIEFQCIPHPVRHLPGSHRSGTWHQIQVLVLSHISILDLPRSPPPPNYH